MKIHPPNDLPRRFPIARWDDGWTLSRMPRMESYAWFVLEPARPGVEDGVPLTIMIRDDMTSKAEIKVHLSRLDDPYRAPVRVREAYRNRLVWFLFDFCGFHTWEIVGGGELDPPVPTIESSWSRDLLEHARLHPLKRWAGVRIEDVQPGRLFPDDVARRFLAAHQMTEELLRVLGLIASDHHEHPIYPRGTNDPRYTEVRWSIELGTRPYILVLSQHWGVPDEQPLWRLHRWDWDSETHAISSSRSFLRTNADLSSPRHRVLGESSKGVVDLLESTNLVLLEEDMDVWLDAHVDVPHVDPFIENLMETYALLSRLMDAPILASQDVFIAWYSSVENP